MQGGMLETTLLKGFNDTMTILVDTAAQAHRERSETLVNMTGSVRFSESYIQYKRKIKDCQ